MAREIFSDGGVKGGNWCRLPMTVRCLEELVQKPKKKKNGGRLREREGKGEDCGRPGPRIVSERE